MKITFGMGGSSPFQAELREWWRANGLLAVDAVGPVLVDTVRRTITYARLMADPEPGDLDFPELRRDIQNDPLTELHTRPLLVDPPDILSPPIRESKVA